MSRRPFLVRGAGFSLIEMMVSLVIGLLALTFATRLILIGERNKQASVGGSDSMQNGMLALFSITSDASQAGFGLNDPALVGCNTQFHDTSGYVLGNATRGGATIHPLAAAVIEPSALGPDQISLYSGSSLTGTGSLVVDLYSGGTSINVADVPYGFLLNDVIVAAAAPGTDSSLCAITQITTNPATQPTTPAQQSLAFGGTGRYAGSLAPAAFAPTVSRVFNLGPAATLAFHTWSVSDGFLRLRATNLTGASVNPVAVIDNVVSLKAQYGFDTRSVASYDTSNGLQIGQWSASMIDADHDGVIGSHGDYARVAALRIAVVARSKNPERPAGGGAVCNATTVQPVVFDSASPLGIAPVPITVAVDVAGDPIDWKCYRYRVFETIVPLRNAGWHPN